MVVVSGGYQWRSLEKVADGVRWWLSLVVVSSGCQWGLVGVSGSRW